MRPIQTDNCPQLDMLHVLKKIKYTLFIYIIGTNCNKINKDNNET